MFDITAEERATVFPTIGSPVYRDLSLFLSVPNNRAQKLTLEWVVSRSPVRAPLKKVQIISEFIYCAEVTSYIRKQFSFLFYELKLILQSFTTTSCEAVFFAAVLIPPA
jgi:hypothetical protein